MVMQIVMHKAHSQMKYTTIVYNSTLTNQGTIEEVKILNMTKFEGFIS